jgi:CHAD domain-containing protein
MVDPVDPHAQPLAAYLAEQAEAATEHLADVPEAHAIHQARVAIRRLRSTLRVFATLLELTEERAAWADGELSWLAELLGEVRDRQVQRDRFITALAELPDEDVPEETLVRAATLLDEALRAEERTAVERLADALEGERYRTLHALLQAWRSEPPVAVPEAPKKHRRAVRRAAEKASRKADKRLAHALASGEDEQLHRARKASKRARYAGEVLRIIGRGTQQRDHYKGLQEVLGDLQDAVVEQETIRRLATSIDHHQTGFVLGLLYARSRDHAAEARHRTRTLLS